jgi:hypothetical protein
MSDEKYLEACAVLTEFLTFENRKPWKPVKSLTKRTDRCIYLYGDNKQYAKIDSRLKCVVEYGEGGKLLLKDFTKRAGDWKVK